MHQAHSNWLWLFLLGPDLQQPIDFFPLRELNSQLWIVFKGPFCSGSLSLHILHTADIWAGMLGIWVVGVGWTGGDKKMSDKVTL